MPHHHKSPKIYSLATTLIIISFLSVGISFIARKMLTEGTYFSENNSLARLDAENKLLKKEILRLRSKFQDKKELVEENKKLRKMLALNKDYSPVFLAATVINKSAWQWQRKIFLDKGSSAGVEPGDLIIDADLNLVGRIEKTLTDSSWGVLASDPNFKITVTCQDLRTTLEGALFKGGRLLYVPYDLTLKTGDPVAVSYPNSGIPAILVGKISSTGKSYDSLTQNVFVEFASDLESLREVFIVEKL